MRSIEVTRTGNASVADQLEEMRAWLCEAGILPVELEPVRILQARVRFRAVLATDEEAERFRWRFDQAAEAGSLPPRLEEVSARPRKWLAER